MIGSVNTGGGGLATNTSVLRVRYGFSTPPTVSKNGITLRHRFVRREGTDYIFYYYINNYDAEPWTVSGYIGEIHISKTIVVNALGDYYVQLVTVYFVDEGIRQTEYIEGLSRVATNYDAGSSGITDDPTNPPIQFRNGHGSASACGSVIYTQNKIDLTHISYLHIIAETNSNGTAANANYLFGIRESMPTSGESNATNTAAFNSYTTFIQKQPYTEYTLDISNLSGEYYIAWLLYKSGGQNITSHYMNMKKLWGI